MGNRIECDHCRLLEIFSIHGILFTLNGLAEMFNFERVPFCSISKPVCGAHPPASGRGLEGDIIMSGGKIDGSGDPTDTLEVRRFLSGTFLLLNLRSVSPKSSHCLCEFRRFPKSYGDAVC